MDSFFKRMRGAFAPFSGLITLAGIAMIIVFGTKYIQHRNTLDSASPDTAIPAVVRQAVPMTCVKSLATSIQAFNAQQRCIDVTTELDEGAGLRTRHIIVEQSTVGSLAAGDHVYVLAAPSGVNGYLIVNAHDSFGFFMRQYAAAGCALLGALMILCSFLLRRGEAEPEALPR
ncbi:MAG TPA: hypothetical protein VGN52_11435 [Burkholderiales bacterium]